MLRFLIHASLALVCFLGVVAASFGAVLMSTPKPDNLRSCITAKMFAVPLCPTDKSYTKLSSISPYIRHAVVVSEDAGFYDHDGLDLHEMKQSFDQNLREGRFARGGSTITQQLAKNVYLSGEKSLFRKAREALIALQIEKLYSKDEILEKYLNVVEFGPKVFGVKQATQFYFGKGPADVTVLEAAWLAFVLPNPEKYSTSFHKRELTKFARSQLRVIVQRMARFKRILPEQESEALVQIDNMFKPATAEDELTLDEDMPAFDEPEATPPPLGLPQEQIVEPEETEETETL